MPRYNTSRKPSSQQVLATSEPDRKRATVNRDKKPKAMAGRKERTKVIQVNIDRFAALQLEYHC